MDERRFLLWLEALNERIQPYDLHFGYRVRDEIARFVGYAMASPLSDGFCDHTADAFVGAIDAAVLMKVLPKFHGPRARVTEPLVGVLSWACNPQQPDDAKEHITTVLNRGDGVSVSGLFAAGREGATQVVLHRVAQKTARMLYEATTTGFTSFA